MFLRLFVCSLLTVSPALAQTKIPTPEKVVQAMGAELRSAKTIGEWINKSSPKNKLFRRTHFSKYTNEKMPQVIVSGRALLVFEKNKSKKPSVLRVSAKTADQLVFTWNGYDITKPKHMNLEKWFGKKFPRFSRTAQWFPANPWMSSAHAQSSMPTTLSQLPQDMIIDPNATSYWTAIMASMSADDWSNTKLQESPAVEDGSILINAGIYMRDQYKLTCSQDGKAGFDFPFDGDPSTPLRIGTSYDAKESLARLTINRVHEDSVLKMKMGEIGRIGYKVMGNDGEVPGSNLQVYLYNGHSDTHSQHSGFYGDETFANTLYTIVNKSDSVTLAPPGSDVLSQMNNMTEGVVALADFARACCSNADCRGQAQLPTSGTGVSQ